MVGYLWNNINIKKRSNEMKKKSWGMSVCVVLLMTIMTSTFFSMAYAQDKVITWKMAGNWGPGDTAYIPETFAKELTEKSGGRLKVITYPGGQLYKIPEIFGALQKNLIQLTDFTSSWWGGNIPLHKMPDMPFFLRNDAELRAWLDAGVWDIWRDETEKAGLKNLVMYGVGGMQCFSTYPVRTLKDAEGHKWRVHTPELAEAVKQIGASPVNVSFTEVYSALQRRVVDAAFGGPVYVYMFKWHEAAKYITKVDLGIAATGIFANKKAFDDLPADLKQIVMNVSKDIQKISWEHYEKVIAEKYKAFQKEGATIYTLPEEDRDKWVKGIQHIWKDTAEKVGPAGIKALEIYYKVFPDRKP